jgi:hypothetical protein
VKGWYSQDGQSWTLYHTRTLNLGPNPIAGLVTAKNGARSRFDHLSLSSHLITNTLPTSEMDFSIQLLPNPGSSDPVLKFRHPNPLVLSLEISSGDGKLIYKEKHQTISGDNSIRFPARHLHQGVYFIRVMADHKMQMLRWIKSDSFGN